MIWHWLIERWLGQEHEKMNGVEQRTEEKLKAAEEAQERARRVATMRLGSQLYRRPPPAP